MSYALGISIYVLISAADFLCDGVKSSITFSNVILKAAKGMNLELMKKKQFQDLTEPSSHTDGNKVIVFNS